MTHELHPHDLTAIHSLILNSPSNATLVYRLRLFEGRILLRQPTNLGLDHIWILPVDRWLLIFKGPNPIAKYLQARQLGVGLPDVYSLGQYRQFKRVQMYDELTAQEPPIWVGQQDLQKPYQPGNFDVQWTNPEANAQVQERFPELYKDQYSIGLVWIQGRQFRSTFNTLDQVTYSNYASSPLARLG